MKRNDYPKVLVGIVTYEGKHYIFPKCYEAVKSFSYPNYDWVIIDNSESTKYYHKLRRLDYKNVKHIKREEHSRDTLSKSQNYIRQIAVDEGYDYVLFVESDLIPPTGIIERLMAYNVPVVGSTYFIGTGKVKLPCIFLEHKIGVMKGTRLIGTIPESFDRDAKKVLNIKEVEDFLGTGLRQVHGCGLGTMLVRTSILKRFPFWTDERFDNKHSDVYWYMDLSNNSIPVYVDTNIIIPHYPSKWDDVKDR